MSVRLPVSIVGGAASDSGFALLEHELLQEKALALGRAGEKAALAVARLNGCAADAPERAMLRSAAAKAVHALFIQRELCGMRRHGDIIREMGIGQEVLVRLGAV